MVANSSWGVEEGGGAPYRRTVVEQGAHGVVGHQTVAAEIEDRRGQQLGFQQGERLVRIVRYEGQSRVGGRASGRNVDARLAPDSMSIQSCAAVRASHSEEATIGGKQPRRREILLPFRR